MRYFHLEFGPNDHREDAPHFTLPAITPIWLSKVLFFYAFIEFKWFDLVNEAPEVPDVPSVVVVTTEEIREDKSSASSSSSDEEGAAEEKTKKKKRLSLKRRKQKSWRHNSWYHHYVIMSTNVCKLLLTIRIFCELKFPNVTKLFLRVAKSVRKTSWYYDVITT